MVAQKRPKDGLTVGPLPETCRGRRFDPRPMLRQGFAGHRITTPDRSRGQAFGDRRVDVKSVAFLGRIWYYAVKHEGRILDELTIDLQQLSISELRVSSDKS